MSDPLVFEVATNRAVGEPITFTLDDQPNVAYTFTAPDQSGVTMALLRRTVAAGGDKTAESLSIAKLITARADWIHAGLAGKPCTCGGVDESGDPVDVGHDQAAHLVERLSDPSDPFNLGDLTELSYRLVEAASGRPTKPSHDS